MTKSRKLRAEEITKDRDIREALLPSLRAKYLHSEGDLALQEFNCNGARVDIAIMNGVMHGFEIKSDSDSLYRLEGQLWAYEGVFDLVTVVVGRRLLKAVESELPDYCGLILAQREEGLVRLVQKRKARRNPNQRARDLARLLWKDEALYLLREIGCKQVNSRCSANVVSDTLARSLKVGSLSNSVRRSIKFRLSSESVPPRELGGGSSTTESTALLDHYSANLEQLLSALSHHHLC